MHRYEDLRVYRHALDLVAETYSVTTALPEDERFGLVQQMNRAATSVVANIAEGAGRGAPMDFARFVRIARGSVFELEAQTAICVRLGYVPNDRFTEMRLLLTDLKYQLNGLDRSLRARTQS